MLVEPKPKRAPGPAGARPPLHHARLGRYRMTNFQGGQVRPEGDAGHEATAMAGPDFREGALPPRLADPPLGQMIEDLPARFVLEHERLVVPDASVVPQAVRALFEDRGVEDTSGKVRACLVRVAAVIGP